MNLLRFISLLTTTITMAAGLAHALALPSKMSLSRADYLTVQQIYRGWAFLGIAVFVALVTTVILAVIDRHDRTVFSLTLGAAVCIALGLVLFFAFTFPANQLTVNWTTLPDNWEALRRRWEYSHAAAAGLYLLAWSALTVALMVRRGTAS